MSKRINTFETTDGTIVTTTSGNPEGTLPNFDVRVSSPPANYKKATEMKINLGEGLTLSLNGRQFRTLAKVCRQHSNAFEWGSAEPLRGRKERILTRSSRGF
jgi:membrane peptidoglycan carboxypeptidase